MPVDCRPVSAASRSKFSRFLSSTCTSWYGSLEASLPLSKLRNYLPFDGAVSVALARSCVWIAVTRFAVEVEEVTPGSVATSSA